MAGRYIRPSFQYFDNSGRILDSGQLFFYDSGTTTLKNVYSDPDGLVPIANPVVLDGAGRTPDVYLDGAYKLIIQDKNSVQIEERDPVLAADDTTKGFGPWNAVTIYAVDDIVRASNGLLYISIVGSNQNNEPSASAVQWTKVQFLSTYNANETYIIGDVVADSIGNVYRSLTNSNLGNTPASSPTDWTSIVAGAFSGDVTVGGTLGVTGTTTLAALDATTGTFTGNTSAPLFSITGATTGSSGNTWIGNDGGGLRINAATAGAIRMGVGGTVGFTLASTGAATFSGNLGVGVAPTYPLDVNVTGAGIGFRLQRDSAVNGAFTIDLGAANVNFDSTDGGFTWATATAGAGAMRLEASGALWVGTTTTPSTSVFGTAISRAGAAGLIENYRDVTGTGTVCNIGGNAGNLLIKGDGDLENTNNAYTGISDLKLKENITDVAPKLAALNQVRVVNYNLIEYPDRKLLGVVAQELELLFPGLVKDSPDFDDEGNDLGTVTKSVKYSVFVPMLIKGMQEQQALIETLTARLDAAGL
jgi:hypothetical protein